MKCSLLSLSCHLDGELEAGKRGELEAHLVSCQRCTAGLAHLTEEVQRIAGLAPVHVPDHSARALMEQLGLLLPGEPLPERSAPRTHSSPPAPTLPWLQPEAGKALPWRAPRGPMPVPRGAPGPGTADPETAPEPESAPEAVMAFEPEDASEAAPPRPVVLEPVPPTPIPPAPTPPPAWLSLEPPTSAPVGIPPHPPFSPSPPLALPGSPPSPGEMAAAAAPSTQPAPRSAAPAFPAPEREPQQAAPPAQHVPAPARPAPPQAGAVAPAPQVPPQARPAGPAPPVPTPARPAAPVPAPQGRPWSGTPASFAPRMPAPALNLAPIPPAPAVPVEGPSMPPMPERLTPAPTPERLTPAPTPVEWPASAPSPADLPQAGPSVRDKGAVPRPGLLQRVRERWAVQRALSRSASDVEDRVDADPERPSTSWARRRQESSVGVGVEVDVPRAQPVEPWPRPEWARTADGTPAPALEGAREAARRRAEASRSRPEPGRHRGALAARLQARRGQPAAPGEGQGEGTTGGQLRDLLERGLHNRALLVFAGALTVLIAIALIMGRSASPIPSHPETARTQPPASARASAAPTAPSAAPPVPSAPAATVPVELNDVRTLGSSAGGAALKDIRYGSHGSFFRAVIDVTPGADGAAPKTTIGFKDPTTLWIVFDGTTAPPGLSAPGAGAVIASVDQVTPGPPGKTIVELKLTRPANLSNLYLTGPMRLVLDLS